MEMYGEMRKYVSGVLIMGIIAMLMGCGRNIEDGAKSASQPGVVQAGITAPKEYREKSNNPITVDYADLPDNFMIQLLPDQEYKLKNGDKSTEFVVKTHALIKAFQKLTYGELEADLSSSVYYKKTEPVLIHYNDKDYIWICKEESDGCLSSTSFFYITEYNSFGSDNGSVNVTIGDAVIDPADYIMYKSVNCFGSAKAIVHYEINSVGKPEEIPSDDEYYLIESPYSEEVLCLDEDIHTWVYEDADAKKSKVVDIPAGTKFKRLRIPKNAEYNYVEGILEDGRVMRVVEEYWFSEPTAYQAMMDKDGKQFTYSVYSNQ